MGVTKRKKEGFYDKIQIKVYFCANICDTDSDNWWKFDFFWDWSEKEEKSEKSRESSVEEMTPDEVIHAFVELMYTYDTSERMFYEGTEEYMTQAGYEMIVPFVGEEDSEAEPEIRMVSKLLEVHCFYQRATEPDREEAIVEVWSTVSGTGSYRIRNLLRIELVQQEDGWKINSCTVLDTLEE